MQHCVQCHHIFNKLWPFTCSSDKYVFNTAGQTNLFRQNYSPVLIIRCTLNKAGTTGDCQQVMSVNMQTCAKSRSDENQRLGTPYFG